MNEIPRVWRIALLFAAAALIVSRRPDGIFHAQFYAEDGRYWFADAYNFGWARALLLPHGGYYQGVARLAGALAVAVPFRFAPLVMNLVALGVQVLPVAFLLSPRAAGFGSSSFRLLMAFVYIALPNTTEISLQATPAQWPLAVAACILVLSRPPSGIWRAVDCAFLAVCGMTGPFCIFLLPVAVAFYFVRRGPWERIVIGILAACVAIQCCALLIVDAHARTAIPGLTPEAAVRILAGHIYLGAILGVNLFAVAHWRAAILCVALLGTGAAAWAMKSAGMELRLFCAFAAMTFAASLVLPTTPKGVNVMGSLGTAPGVRYWFPATLAFAWSLLSGARRKQFLCCGLLCLMPIGLIRDWRIRPFPEENFPVYAKEFEALGAGSTITIPEFPAGWSLTLRKH